MASRPEVRNTSSELVTFAANSAAREAPRAAEDSSPVYISPWCLQSVRKNAVVSGHEPLVPILKWAQTEMVLFLLYLGLCKWQLTVIITKPNHITLVGKCFKDEAGLG